MLSIAPLVWGEIPVSDMDRAIAFYQQHFGVEFKRDDMEDMQYATIETEDEGAPSIGLVKCSMSNRRWTVALYTCISALNCNL